jgi:hypothetical protein
MRLIAGGTALASKAIRPSDPSDPSDPIGPIRYPISRSDSTPDHHRVVRLSLLLVRECFSALQTSVLPALRDGVGSAALEVHRWSARLV